MLINSNSTKNVTDIGIRKLSSPANKTHSGPGNISGGYNTIQHATGKHMQKLSDSLKSAKKPTIVIRQGKVISRNYYDHQSKGSGSKIVLGCKNTIDSQSMLTRNL